MPVSKKQLKRMILFLGEVKTNSYPNSFSFSKKLRKMDLKENQNINCTPRTVQRDIQALKEDFKAPLKYDHERKGYYLDNPYWEFNSPILSDNKILAMVLGARLAENIFPEPLRSQIEFATAEQLTTNANELLETAYLDSLMVCSSRTVNINPEIFETVFNAWKNNEALDIEYSSAQDFKSERRIDPHILAFQDGAWFIKAFCHKKQKHWIFAIHRIISAEKTGKHFEPDKKLNEKTREEGLFLLKRLENVVLRCDNRIINYARDYRFHPEQTIKQNDDDTFDLHIPFAAEDELIRWIMWQAGQAEVLKPKSFRKTIAGYAENLFFRNS